METWDSQLKIEIDNVLSQIRPYWEKGDKLKVEELYLEAWKMVPEPKYKWNDSQWLILLIFDLYFELDKPEKLLPFIPILEKLYRDGKKDGTVAIESGMVYYETNQLEKAYEYFDFLFRNYKKRPFQGRDKKYLEFYLTEKERRKKLNTKEGK